MKQELDSPLGGSSTPLVCPFCGRNDFKRKNSLTYHIKYCKMNPDRVVVSDESKQKISEATKRQWEDPERREKQSERFKGENNPMYGKQHTEESKQKISETTKKGMEDPEVRCKISEAQKIVQNKPEVKQKKSEALNKPDVKQKLSESANKRWDNPEYRQKMTKSINKRWDNPEYRQKMSEAQNDPEVKQKIYETKKKNNSFNTSKIEEQLKEYLISHNINFETQYKSEQYPFRCDFYLPKYDLYIEIQGSWTHGGKPYNETDPDCIKQLELWKSKNTDYYNNAIDTWTIRDPKKRETAKQNNLNWIEIFSVDLDECVDIIQKHI